MTITSSWLIHLKEEFSKDYMLKLRKFLLEEKMKNKTIFPPSKQIFSALNLTPFENVKVVILGQDPYHGVGQANGLCFSVTRDTRLPPSLKNIYKELSADLKIKQPIHGDLSSWAKQGVLLLNNVLTVEEGLAASHQGRGWETFTDFIIRILSEKKMHLVFILWGSMAQKKGSVIDEKKHHIIQSVHPSPLSAHRGFFGSRPFSKTNSYLQSKGIGPIDWAAI